MNWVEDFKKIILNENPDLESLIEFKNKYIPKKLYQYGRFSPEKIDSLKKSNVWAGNPTYLNDPYDCHIFIDEDAIKRKTLKSIFEDLAPTNIKNIMSRIDLGINPREILFDIFDYSNKLRNDKSVTDHVDSFIEKSLCSATEEIKDVYKSLRGHFGVSSFSERVDSILMWAHYTENHQGYCVEYDFTEHTVKENIFPVIYQNEVFESSCVLNNVSRTQIIIAVLVKALDWNYEREWRLVIPNKENIDKGLNIDVPNPTAIYLGSHISKDNEEVIKYIYQERNIPIYRMVHSLNEFKMVPHLIT